MSRVVAEPIKSSLEMDAIRARHQYCYTENRPQIVAWVKRQMHKRDRRRALDELAREAQKVEVCYDRGVDAVVACPRTPDVF